MKTLALANGSSSNLSVDGGAERIGVVRTTSNMFSLLGARPALGRVFLPEEDAPGRPPTVVLSHGLWQRRFGSDPNVAGRALTLNGQSYTVVGVMPADFSLGYEVMPTVGAVQQPDVLLPLALTPSGWRVRATRTTTSSRASSPGATVGAGAGRT